MEFELSELEQQFRKSWRTFDPGRYAAFLAQTTEDNRIELLARLLGAELEYTYQPPFSADEHETTVEDDDQRIKPSLQLFLLRFPELKDQNEIVIRLSVLEFALRLRHDRVPPNPDSYLMLCSQSQDRLIKLLRLTENKLPVARNDPDPDLPVGVSDSTVKETRPSVSVTLDPLPFNLGCFLLVRLIGRGGMGYVHAAIDLRSTAQVAVKVMRRIDPWSVYRFIEEFSWLSQLNHPNLVKLYDAFSEGDVRYFSMELVEGKTIRQWFRKYSEEDADRWNLLRRILAQAASAVHFLHEHGVVHCDIKCSNLMIASRRHAVLLDLGLAVREGNSQPLVGTLQYMAPEVLDGEVPSRQSDWYSFGMMLFEVLTDSYPPIQVNLSASHPDEKYQLDQHEVNDRLAHSDPDLARLCCQLLTSDPSQRPLGPAVLQELGGFLDNEHLASGFTHVAGQQLLIEQLDEVWTARDSGQKLVVIRGESGAGKTTLLTHWQRCRTSQDEWLIDLRCYRQDHTPLRLLNLVVQELVQVLKHVPEENWRDSLSRHVEEIGAAFPQVCQLEDAENAIKSRPPSATPAYLIKSRGIAELTEWIVELSRVRPLLLIVDDGQWADKESLQWIGELTTTKEFQGIIVLVDETDSDASDAWLHSELQPRLGGASSTSWVELKVGPLAEEACLELLNVWSARGAVDLTPAIARNIAERSGGSPFLLQELFRAFAHYVKRDGVSSDQWLDESSQGNVRRRFSMLPIQSENVLQYLAVAGQSIGFHHLQMVSRILPHELQRTLNLLASQGWIRSRSNDTESDVEIAHENFRRVVLESMPAERLHRRHFRTARMLSSEVPPPWSRMADHYWSAERYREAATCYVEAARKAAKSASYQEALRFLDRANHPDADRSPTGKTEVTRLRADCLAGIGNATAAAEIYDQLTVKIDQPQERLVNQCLAGEQWIRGGQPETGIARLSEVLHRMGITNWDRSRSSQLRLRLRLLRAVTFESPLESVDPPQEEFTSLEQSLNRVSVPLTFLNNQLGPDLVLRLRQLVNYRGSSFDRALAILNWGGLLAFGGPRWRKSAIRLLWQGRQLARESRSPAALGSAHLCMFVWQIERGEFLKAIRHGQRAIDAFHRELRSLQWEIQFTHWGMLGCYWHACQFRTLRSSTLELRQSADDRSDSMSRYLMNVAAAHWSDLIVDDIVGARLALEKAAKAIANQSFQLPRFFLWLSRVIQLLYEGDPVQARQVLMEDWGNLTKNYILRTHHYRWLALSLRLCCDFVCMREQPDQHQHYERDASWAIGRMRRFREPGFAASATAFQLLLQAARGNLAPNAEWGRAVETLNQANLHLLGHALQWHREVHYASCQSGEETAETALRDQGCKMPEKLLDVILPLPKR